MAEIVVLTAGSTGDVEPFAALAGRLAGRGHRVTFAADAGFESLAPGDGVEFAPIRADFQSLLPTPEGKRPSVRDDVFPVMRGMLEDSWAVAKARQPDAIVAHDKTLAAPHIAERLGIPHVRALAVPMLTPTREFPLPAMVRHNLGGSLNRASYRLVGMLTRPYSGLIRSWREDHLALAARGKPPPPARTLYCYSPSLVPTPRDWPPEAVATGYWLREGDGKEPVDPGMEAFVADGAPPVYVGFGSSVGPDPARVGAAVSGALREAGARAVIATGWGGLADVDRAEDTIVIERAPHRWLFSRVAAVVHHGGAGTTAAGLLAGRPTVVCPFQGDQHFWGAAVHRVGAGPEPLPAKKLNAQKLAAAIRAAIQDPGMQRGAIDLSQRMGREDGAGRASEEIEASLAKTSHPSALKAGWARKFAWRRRSS
jgi:sterol 3beta-glucosyltransferase